MRCKALRRDIAMLQKSQHLSQRAFKHTECFVDEVVHVNEQLVQTLNS
jgi:hypothetical protein